MRVLVFGASITYGAWDSKGGWVERLKSWAHKRTIESEGENKLQILNLGIGGDSSTKILKRMRAEISARHSKSWPFVFVFCFGTNDERKLDGIVETSLNQFALNAKQIIDTAKLYSSKVLIVEACPLAKAIVEFKGQEYSDERMKEYQAKLRAVAEAEDVPFVATREAFEQAGLENLYSWDNIHPNDKGHELIAKLVKPELEKLIKNA